VIDAQEPLLGGAEDERVLRAPAVRVGMRERLAVHQPSVGAQIGDDRVVGCKHLASGVPAGFVGEATLRVDRRQHRQVVTLADLKVLVAVPGRGVDRAGAGVGGDVGLEHRARGSVEERMAEHVAPVERRHVHRDAPPFFARHSGRGEKGVGETSGDDEQLIADVDRDVVERRIEADRQVGGQCPRRRRPDHRAELPGACA
jgi:hypothetical protein